MVCYSHDVRQILLNNITDEKKAAEFYRTAACDIPDPCVAAVLNRIARDEVLHAEIFTRFLKDWPIKKAQTAWGVQSGPCFICSEARAISSLNLPARFHPRSRNRQCTRRRFSGRPVVRQTPDRSGPQSTASPTRSISTKSTLSCFICVRISISVDKRTVIFFILTSSFCWYVCSIHPANQKNGSNIGDFVDPPNFIHFPQDGGL